MVVISISQEVGPAYSLCKLGDCLYFTGTFGRIFHGVLLDEKDPSKEKRVFVKTVKGTAAILHSRLTFLILPQPKNWLGSRHYFCITAWLQK